MSQSWAGLTDWVKARCYLGADARSQFESDSSLCEKNGSSIEVIFLMTWSAVAEKAVSAIGSGDAKWKPVCKGRWLWTRALSVCAGRAVHLWRSARGRALIFCSKDWTGFCCVEICWWCAALSHSCRFWERTNVLMAFSGSTSTVSTFGTLYTVGVYVAATVTQIQL